MCVRIHNRGQEPLDVGTEDPVLIAVQHYAKLLAFSEIMWSTGKIEKAVDADDGSTYYKHSSNHFFFFQIFGKKSKWMNPGD